MFIVLTSANVLLMRVVVICVLRLPLRNCRPISPYRPSPTAHTSLITRIWQLVSASESDGRNSSGRTQCSVVPGGDATSSMHLPTGETYTATFIGATWVAGRRRQYASADLPNNDARKFDYRRPVKPIILHNFQLKTLRRGVCPISNS